MTGWGDEGLGAEDRIGADRVRRSGKESNLPGAGPPRRPGFEDRADHQTHAAPRRWMLAAPGVLVTLATFIVGLGAWAGVAGAVTSGANVPAASAGDARVIGTFSMIAHVTTAVNVKGEHRGQVLRRTWYVTPSFCSGSRCDRLVLRRRRADGDRNRVVLYRTGPGRYSGQGAFYVALQCEGHVYRHGSRAPFRMTITVTKVATVEHLRFARSLRATYLNTQRTDTTPCPLGPSHDAASYTGKLSSKLATPPAASFTYTTPTPTNGTVDFTGKATRGELGYRIKRYHWSFGDPGSGKADTSTQRDPTHTFSASGSYTVTLTVTDAEGLTGSVSHTVVVPSPLAL